ncbi:hypothetical protein ACIQW5_10525 [Methylorubrum thiocyanatum]|uniref:hypothetical protein n=1 Tax=Methylorubrum thiocyanatum TaxID=47958 RepID=UPI00383A929D
MATTIRVQIANGYRPQVDAYCETHPGLTRDEATRVWVTERYGAWITTNVTEAFELERVSAQDFDVKFGGIEHARAFQAAIGGSEVTDAVR